MQGEGELNWSQPLHQLNQTWKPLCVMLQVYYHSFAEHLHKEKVCFSFGFTYHFRNMLH